MKSRSGYDMTLDDAQNADAPPDRSFGPNGPPDGSPNVLIVLIDDMGFGASSPFGGPVRMPAAEKLASIGLRYTRFHTTGMCTPTRASLLTGRNAHRMGMAVPMELSTAQPGYNGARPGSIATLARMLQLNGYVTAAFGKMHQTPLAHVSPSGPFDQWPTREGFDKFYGFIGGDADHWYPALYEGTTAVEPPAGPKEGYHLSEDLADSLVTWIQSTRTVTPDRPFFAYLSFGATHAPFHVHPQWRTKYTGEFDHGWNVQRNLTLAKQKQLGVVPPDSRLAPWPETAPLWETLSPDDRRAATMLMELYAGFAEHTDAQVGRVIDYLESAGLSDNTVILYLLGDNGASGEGGTKGTSNECVSMNGLEETAREILERADQLGGPSTYPHYPVGWALAMDSPYQWTKQMAGHFGATRNGFILSWPKELRRHGGGLRHQWHHVVDIAPTLLDLIGIPFPDSVDGDLQKPFDGVSMLPSFEGNSVKQGERTQYFEVLGNRGIYSDGWMASVAHKRGPWLRDVDLPLFSDDRWELYDLTRDWTQANDVADDFPERLRIMKDLFDVEARDNSVLPLDDRFIERLVPSVAGRWDPYRGRTSVVYSGGLPRLPEHAVIDTRNVSHSITASVHVDKSDATGVIASMGSVHGGWVLYLMNGVLAYCHNVAGRYVGHVYGNSPVDVGAHELVADIDLSGDGFGSGAMVRLSMDGRSVGSGWLDATTPYTFGVSAHFSIGKSVGVPVTGELVRGETDCFPGRVFEVAIAILGSKRNLPTSVVHSHATLRQ